MNRVALVILALAVAAASAWGFRVYQVKELRKAIAPAIKSTTIRTANIIELQKPGSNLTFKEMFSKVDDTVKEIDSAMIAVQSLDQSPDGAAAALALDYMKASASLVRAMGDVSRKLLTTSTAQSAMREAAEDLRTTSTSSYSFDSALQRATRAMDQNKEAAEKYVAAQKEATEAVNRFAVVADSVRKEFGPEFAVPEKNISDIRDEYSQKKPDAKSPDAKS